MISDCTLWWWRESPQRVVTGKQVCRNFYLRAHGIHHGFARKMERVILEQNRSTLSVEKDQRQTKEKELTRPEVIKDKLRDDSHRFYEKSSTEKVIVLPDRNIKSVYEAYKPDFQSEVSLRHQTTLCPSGSLANFATNIPLG